ncbi:26325_t:CDS:2, partial [Dentiscutata erythropus]
YVPEDYKENTESTSIPVESESVITESITADKFDFDIELSPILFNYDSFDKARELAEADERVDINLLRENNTDTNIDSSDIVSSSVFDLESELNDENEYLVKDTTTEIANEDKKKVFLTHLVSILPTFFDIKSFPVTANSPSLLFVKIVLRLEHVNLTNIVDQKFNFTSETALDLGKALGVAIWNVRHE